MNDALLHRLNHELNKRAEEGNPAQFWLRDDDAIEPSDALEQLLALTGRHAIPLTLAVIPALSDQALAPYLANGDQLSVAVHGWSHTNHASRDEKKRELGLNRPIDETLAELSAGFSQLADGHGSHFVPLLVPPWNRISSAIVDRLPELGFRGLSVFGEAQPAAITVVNTHVDLIDWRGTRGGRDHDTLLAELLQQLQVTPGPIGLLTHHLVHDDIAWRFLEDLFAITANRADCKWVAITEFLPSS